MLVSAAQGAHGKGRGAPAILMQGYTESSLVAMQKFWLNVIRAGTAGDPSHHFYRG